MLYTVCFTQIICSKSIMDIKVSNIEKSKNNLEKCMKVGPRTLYIYIRVVQKSMGKTKSLKIVDFNT